MNKIKSLLEDGLIKAGLAASGVALTFGIISGISYMDLPLGFISSSDARLKSGAAAVVSGLVSQELGNGNNVIDMESQKFFWPDSGLTGKTSPSSIETRLNTWFSSANFHASRDAYGDLNGRVDKSKYDWGVHSKGSGSGDYEISRIGLQWNSGIKDLVVSNGKISGTFIRPGLSFDLGIEGTYDKQGNVTIDIDNAFVFGITLEGTIKPRGL